MTSIIRVGHAKSSPALGAPLVQIDEDSTERIMNCIQTLSELSGGAKVDTDDEEAIVKEIFLRDTKKAFQRMISAQEVRIFFPVDDKIALSSFELSETCF